MATTSKATGDESSEVKFAQFLKLPDDILVNVFGTCTSVQDKLMLGATCKRLRSLLYERDSWRDRVIIQVMKYVADEYEGGPDELPVHVKLFVYNEHNLVDEFIYPTVQSLYSVFQLGLILPHKVLLLFRVPCSWKAVVKFINWMNECKKRSKKPFRGSQVRIDLSDQYHIAKVKQIEKLFEWLQACDVRTCLSFSGRPFQLCNLLSPPPNLFRLDLAHLPVQEPVPKVLREATNLCELFLHSPTKFKVCVDVLQKHGATLQQLMATINYSEPIPVAQINSLELQSMKNLCFMVMADDRLNRQCIANCQALMAKCQTAYDIRFMFFSSLSKADLRGFVKNFLASRRSTTRPPTPIYQRFSVLGCLDYFDSAISKIRPISVKMSPDGLHLKPKYAAEMVNWMVCKDTKTLNRVMKTALGDAVPDGADIDRVEFEWKDGSFTTVKIYVNLVQMEGQLVVIQID